MLPQKKPTDYCFRTWASSLYDPWSNTEEDWEACIFMGDSWKRRTYGKMRSSNLWGKCWSCKSCIVEDLYSSCCCTTKQPNPSSWSCQSCDEQGTPFSADSWRIRKLSPPAFTSGWFIKIHRSTANWFTRQEKNPTFFVVPKKSMDLYSHVLIHHQKTVRYGSDQWSPASASDTFVSRHLR